MALQKSLGFWTIFVLGLLYISIECDARAVNVSNTWTMPQEGLNVFYRFFRDRISWFEADAVCQFHHANLVTVDNSFQFDATRDLLRELDVNDIVWIGLMRPQNSERFMWSNSRALAADTGYWAESIPLMDSPLCAVIDPIRDYRWHALRCGGPETASFLCEMPVPSWADACIIKEMPSLTMQYMADTASIELIRNCGEEGLLRQSCREKEDRERVVRELICPKERYEAQRINDITSSHFKSLQIINSIPTDNNENNDIELLPLATNAAGTQSYASGNSDFSEQAQTEKNTVQKLIEQFNVDELMQADQAGNEPNTGYRIPGEIPKPVKKSAKKTTSSNYNMKSKYAVMQMESQQQYQQQQKEKKQQMRLPLEDMMMGDQPVAYSAELHSGQAEHEPSEISHEDNEQSNEIEQPLPHIKKVLPQDLRTMATITERSHAAAEEKLKKEHDKQQQTTIETTTGTTTTTTAAVVSTTPAPKSTKQTPAATTINPVTFATDVDISARKTTTTTFYDTSNNADVGVVTTAAAPMHTANELPTATIGHPMHPQQPRSNVITEETQHPHIKETADSSHFIPPMLLVKSHYVPPTKHEQQHEHQQHEHEHEHQQQLETQQQQHHQPTMLATAIDTAATALAAKETSSNINSSSDEVATAISFTVEVNTQTTAQPLLTTMKTDTAATTASAWKEVAAFEILITNEKIVAATSDIQKIDADLKIKENVEQQQQPLEIAATTKTTTTNAPMTTKEKTTTTEKVAMETIKNENEKPATTEGVAAERVTATTIVETTTNSNKILPAAAAAAATTTINSDIQHGISDVVTKEKQETLTTDAPTKTTLAADVTTTTTATATAGVLNATANVATATTTTTAAAITTTADESVTATTMPPPTTTTTATATSTHNFLKEETETPFKPNRRRSLTKPETASYFKKILG